MISISSRIALSAFCLAGSMHTAALADQGGLILPSAADGAVRLLLPDGVGAGDPSSYLQVFVGPVEACCDGKSAMAGRYGVDGQAVTFEPAFSFVTGQDYTVRSLDFSDGADRTRSLTAFSIAPQSAPVPPEVIGIYPSGPDIPENTLRFYIHFSTPMMPHMSTEFINLVRSDGVTDSAAFMTFKQELWNEDRTRLTLLMDPGRIKRGVAQNLTLGPALLEGNSYSIVIEGGWANVSGDQVAPEYSRNFTVSQALRAVPDIELWDIEKPRRSTRDPLVINFDRPFDLPLAQGAIAVLGEDGAAISGSVTIESHQRAWRFEPEEVWSDVSVRLVVDARLEDVAGNNFRELLDHSVETDVLDIDQTSVTLVLNPAPQ